MKALNPLVLVLIFGMNALSARADDSDSWLEKTYPKTLGFKEKESQQKEAISESVLGLSASVLGATLRRKAGLLGATGSAFLLTGQLFTLDGAVKTLLSAESRKSGKLPLLTPFLKTEAQETEAPREEEPRENFRPYRQREWDQMSQPTMVEASLTKPFRYSEVVK